MHMQTPYYSSQFYEAASKIWNAWCHFDPYGWPLLHLRLDPYPYPNGIDGNCMKFYTRTKHCNSCTFEHKKNANCIDLAKINMVEVVRTHTLAIRNSLEFRF